MDTFSPLNDCTGDRAKGSFAAGSPEKDPMYAMPPLNEDRSNRIVPALKAGTGRAGSTVTGS